MGTITWHIWNDNTGGTMDIRILGPGGACSACVNVGNNASPPLGQIITTTPNGTFTVEVNTITGDCSGASTDFSLTTNSGGDQTFRVFCL